MLGENGRFWQSDTTFRHVIIVRQSLVIADPRWDTVDAEIKIMSIENLELSQVLSFKVGVDHNVASHASSTARNFAFLISAVPVFFSDFFFF